MRELLDEVLLAQIGGIDAQFARGDLHQPLDHEGRLRAAGAAISVDRHGIGIDRIDLAIDRRDLILAGEQGAVEIGRHRRRERRHIGAEIGDGLDPEPRDLAVGVQRHLRVRDMVAAVAIGEESLRAIGHPFHRPADLARRPQADDLLRIDENLGAEAAADIGRDHAQLVLGRHADEGGDDQARNVGILRGVPERETVRAGVVFADRGTRLDRIRRQPVVDEIELGDVLGRLERRLGRLRIAEVPLIDGVARRDLVDLRARLRLGRIGHRRQRLVVDLDLLGGVLGLRQRLGEDDGDRIADMVRLAMGDRRMRRILHLRAVLGRDHPAANETADLVGGKLGAGEHREHARHRRRRLAVDAPDLGVGMRRAQEVGLALAGTVDVVGVVALAGDEALVLFAAHRRTDTGRAHGSLLPG